MGEISAKLVNRLTHKIIGVLYSVRDYVIPLSIDKAKELGVSDIDIIEYMSDIEEIGVYTYKNYFVDASNYVIENESSIGDDFVYDFGSSIEVDGYVFNKTSLLELDNEVWLRRLKIMESGGVVTWQ